jgi:hypothetical protein
VEGLTTGIAVVFELTEPEWPAKHIGALDPHGGVPKPGCVQFWLEGPQIDAQGTRKYALLAEHDGSRWVCEDNREPSRDLPEQLVECLDSTLFAVRDLTDSHSHVD